MEMISAKTAYLDSLAGYTDELEKIKEQILEVIQLANTEGKFQATYSIEQCPQEIINWLGEYGYTVVIEDGYIQIDWGDALVDEADLQVQVDEQDIDPTDIDNTTVEEQVVDGGGSAQEEETLKEGLKEIYIKEQDLRGYRVNNIIVYSSEPVEQIDNEGTATVSYNSYFHLTLVNNETEEQRFANLWISRKAASPLEIGGSMTAMIEGSCDKTGHPMVFLNVPMEKEAAAEGDVDEDTSVVPNIPDYASPDDLNSATSLNIATAAQLRHYTFSNAIKTSLLQNYEDQRVLHNSSVPVSELEDKTIKQILQIMWDNSYTVDETTVKQPMIQEFLAAQRLARFYVRTDFDNMSIPDILQLSIDKGYSILGSSKNSIVQAILNGRAQEKENINNTISILYILNRAGLRENWEADLRAIAKSELISDINAAAPENTYADGYFDDYTVEQLIDLATEQQYDINNAISETKAKFIQKFDAELYKQVDLIDKTINNLLTIAEHFDYDLNSAELRIVNLFLDAQGDRPVSEDETVLTIEKVYVYYEVNSDGRPYRGTIPFEANNIYASTISTVPSSIIKPHIYEYMRTVQL